MLTTIFITGGIALLLLLLYVTESHETKGENWIKENIPSATDIKYIECFKSYYGDWYYLFTVKGKQVPLKFETLRSKKLYISRVDMKEYDFENKMN